MTDGRTGKKHALSLPGGKDSTAMLLMLLERGGRVDEAVMFDGGRKRQSA